jgi:hypothetical protein
VTGTSDPSTRQRDYRKLTTAELVDAITKSRGLITPAAAALGCAPLTIRRRAASSPAIAAALHEARQRTLDLAELALYKAVSTGEPWAVQFILKTLGKDRGYVERQEQRHGGPDGGPLALTVTVVPDADSTPETWAQKLDVLAERQQQEPGPGARRSWD